MRSGASPGSLANLHEDIHINKNVDSVSVMKDIGLLWCFSLSLGRFGVLGDTRLHHDSIATTCHRVYGGLCLGSSLSLRSKIYLWVSKKRVAN